MPDAFQPRPPNACIRLLPESDWQPIDSARLAALQRDWNLTVPKPPDELDWSKVWVAELSFYPDYRLVCVPAVSLGSAVYVLHTPGDLRPLDASVRAVDRVNRLAPLELTPENVRRYAALWLAFEMSASAGPGSIELAQTVWPSTVSAEPEPREESYWLRMDLYAPDKKGWESAQVVVTRTGEVTMVNSKACEAPKSEDGKPSKLEPLVALPCARIRPATEWLRWLKPSLPVSQKLHTLLTAWNVDLQRVTLRVAPLPFYKHFVLLEISEPGPSGWQRRYALAAPDGVEPPAPELVALNGKSPPIHEVNHIEGVLQLTPESVDCYIAFFCWAVQGEEGSFLVPRGWRSLPLRQAPEAEGKTRLEKITDWGLREFSDSEGETRGLRPRAKDHLEYRRRVVLAYSHGLFRAWMSVQHSSGMVEMLEDDPIENDLPTKIELFGSARLGVLTSRPDQRGPNRYLRRPVRRPVSPVTADVFKQKLVSDAELADLEVSEPVEWPSADQLDTRARTLRNCNFLGGLIVRNATSRTPITLVDCTLAAGLDAADAQLHARWTFVACRIDSDPDPNAPRRQVAVNLQNATLKYDFELYACVITGRFIGNCLHAQKNLRLRGCSFGTDKEQEVEAIERLDERSLGESMLRDPGPAISMQHARIDGELEISSANVEVKQRLGGAGGIALDSTARACFIHGGLDLTGVEAGSLWLAGTAVIGDTDLSSITVRHNLSFCIHGYHSQRAAQFYCSGWLFLTSAHIGGDVELNRARISHELRLYRATLDGNLSLSGARIGHELNACFAVIHGFVTAFLQGQSIGADAHLQIGGNLALSGSNIGFVELCGVDVKGRLEITASEFKSLKIVPAICRSTEPTNDGRDRFWIKENRIASVAISQVTTTADICLVDIRTQPPSSDNVGEKADDARAGFTLTHCTIGGDLNLSMPRPDLSLQRRFGDESIGAAVPWERPASPADVAAAASATPQAVGRLHAPCQADLAPKIWGNLNLGANDIKGGLDLRNLDVEGQILLSDTHVQLDLQMGADYEHRGVHYANLTTRCLHLDMEMLDCAGDVHLSGLRVEVKPRSGEEAQRVQHILKQGQMTARGMVIKGDLYFGSSHNPRRQTVSPDASALRDASKPMAWIGGDLDLRGAQVGHLVLTGKSLQDGCERVWLDDCTFKRLEMVKPPPNPKVSLVGMKADLWTFIDEDNPNTEDRPQLSVEDIEQVLSNMPSLDRKTWLNVETLLRNEGRDDDANQIYLKMRRTARRSGAPSSIFKRIRERLHDFSIRYGTDVYRPMYFAALLVPLSLWIFSDPRNVMASSSFMQVLDDKQIARVQADATCTLPTVGIVQARANEPATPREKPMAVSPNQLQLPWGLTDAIAMTVRYQVPIIGLLAHNRWEASCHALPVGITADDYAFWLELYHWIAWPLFLIGAAAGAYRGRRSG